jgi:hypothetical protein
LMVWHKEERRCWLREACHGKFEAPDGRGFHVNDEHTCKLQQIDGLGDNKGKNLINYLRDFQSRDSFYDSFGVFYPRGWYIYIGRRTPNIYVN